MRNDLDRPQHQHSMYQLHQSPMQRFRMTGFTLIELMITVAIIALLSAIALPAYSSYIAKARRADARTQLVQVAQYMQRFYAANDSFLQDRAGGAVTAHIPASLQQSPADSTSVYVLTIPPELLTTSSFEIRMTPLDTGPMKNDACGAFTLTSTGIRGVLVAGVAGQAPLRDTCWR